MDQGLPPQFPSTPTPVESAPASAVTPSAPLEADLPPAPVAPASTPLKPNVFNRLWFWGLLLVLINLAVLFWFGVYPRLGAKIVIADQRVVDRIHVDLVTTTQAAALALQFPGEAGEPARGLVSTGILPPNTYADFDLSLNEYLQFTEDPALKDFKPGTIIIATLYLDADGDRAYDATIDTELAKDLFGKPLTATFITQ